MMGQRGPIASAVVKRGEWGTFFRPSRIDQESSSSEKENPQMIAVPEETFSRFADVLERIAEVVERLGPKEEIKEEPNQRTLTPQEAAKILRLNVQTVLEWCRTGKLKGIKIGGNEINGRGGKWLIPRDEIDAYLRRDRLIKGPRKEGGT
jgi:excisionase family DNA binding protein